MITNERQYKISRQQLSKFQKAIENYSNGDAERRLGSEILARAEMDALQSEYNILSDQISEYEALRSGVIKRFEATNLDELPGIFIRSRIAQQLTQRELGDIVGVKEQQIQRYEATNYSGASLRRLHEISQALKLNITKIIELTPHEANTKLSSGKELAWSNFPIREMYRRGWFEDFNGTLKAALDPSNQVVQNYIGKVIRQPAKAYYRRHVRSGATVDDYALFAWECRILSIAKNKGIKVDFNPESLSDEWITDLVQESRKADGVSRAIAKIEETGIAVIIEPHLSGTHLDGAAFLYRRSPIIGLTLRYDRLDNFWFALLHEIAHVKKHIRQGKIVRIFDDLELKGTDRIETEADSFAQEALISYQVWDKAICRFLRTEETVKLLAKEISIHPSIIAGRIRYEANNYTILSDLVGQGMVRKHFTDVNFGV